jgi:hypothetical protein
MTALQRIQRAGFEVSLSGDTFTVSPASRLTTEQREFLKTHKAEIVKELSASGTAAPAPDPLLVEVWTPSGASMTTRANDAEHAARLQRMNPKPTNPAPKPPEPKPDADRTSEAEHNAQGRFFKFLATWPDGRQCYLYQMPRMTTAEMLAQYPDAATIQPIENEEYPDD